MAYFSNGSEGMVLDDQCATCIFGDGPCPILLAQMNSNYDAVGNTVATEILNTIVWPDGTCAMLKNFPDILLRK